MNKPMFVILCINTIEGLNVNFRSFVNDDIDFVIRWIRGEDISRIAIWKGFKHIQFPTRPLSDEDLKRILMEA